MATPSLPLPPVQLTRHISTAVWSSADKVLYLSLGLVFFLPQKVIGESSWGLFATSQAILTMMYMLADGFALQVMVNFGVVESQKKEAMTTGFVMYLFFIAVVTTAVWLGREELALLWKKPDLAPLLGLFPLVAAGFFLRNLTLKIAQLHIDTRGTFIIDAAWVVAMIAMLLHGWRTGWLVDELDMMIVSAASAGVSSVVGLILYRRTLHFAKRVERTLFRKMFRFGITQIGSATTMSLLSQGDIIFLNMFGSNAAVIGNYDAAKKFFRGFEGIRDAGALFVYPAVARLSSQERWGELRTLLEKMIAFMTIVLIPIVLFIWFGPIDAIFAFIFKENYRLAPDLFRIMSLGALAIPLSMNTYVLLGMSQVRKLFAVSSISLILFIITSLLLVPRLGGQGQAIAMAVSFWSLGLLSIVLVVRLTELSPRRILRRWRDVLDFARKAWRRGMREGRRKGKGREKEGRRKGEDGEKGRE